MAFETPPPLPEANESVNCMNYIITILRIVIRKALRRSHSHYHEDQKSYLSQLSQASETDYRIVDYSLSRRLDTHVLYFIELGKMARV